MDHLAHFTLYLIPFRGLFRSKQEQSPFNIILEYPKFENFQSVNMSLERVWSCNILQVAPPLVLLCGSVLGVQTTTKLNNK